MFVHNCYLLKIKGEVSVTPTSIGGLHVSHTSPKTREELERFALVYQSY